MRHRIITFLDTSATVVVIVAGAIVALVAARQAWVSPGVTRAAIETYRVGDVFPELPGVDAAPAGTLVAWVHSQCRYCTASMAFYRRLSEGPRTRRIVVMGTETVDVLRGYLREHGVTPDAVLSVAATSVKFLGTPTLVAFDGSRRITGVWRGRLQDAADELAVERLVR